MKSVLEANDRDFLNRLHRMGGGTVQEICDEIGVTATAVRQRLNRLHGVGVVSREAVRSGRGRPHHTYRVTEEGIRALGDNYSDLAMILWREVQRIEPGEVRDQVLQRIRESLVSEFGHVKSGELSDRVDELGTVLAERGYDVEVDDSGPLPILRENNCPYLELASSDPAICELEQAVFERLLGTSVRLTQCCLDGHSCCEFEACHDSAS